MYVIQVRPQAELKTRNYLQRKGIRGVVPITITKERRKNRDGSVKWIDVQRILFPGYVFVDLPQITDKDYYKILNCDYILKFLGQKGHPERLRTREIYFINEVAAGALPDLSECNDLKVGTQWLHRGLWLEVTAIDKRQRKVTIDINIGNMPHKLTFPYNVETNESQNDALSNPHDSSSPT